MTMRRPPSQQNRPAVMHVPLYEGATVIEAIRPSKGRLQVTLLCKGGIKMRLVGTEVNEPEVEVA